MLFLIYLIPVLCVKGALYYDSYTGKEITKEEVKRHDKANTTFWCVNEIQPCDPMEGRRVDGSCNNLQFPSRGTSHTPFVRVLPPAFDKNFEPRKAASGNDLPLPRFLRTSLVSVGRVPSRVFTNLAIHFFVFMSADIVSLHDTVNYVAWRPYCCAERGKKDYMCVPNKIPDDDPVHRFSGVRCQNMTRPETFQSIGCVKNDTSPDRVDQRRSMKISIAAWSFDLLPPIRWDFNISVNWVHISTPLPNRPGNKGVMIVSSTPLLDLSVIYGNLLPELIQRGRLFQGGLLKTEEEEGRIWPPSSKTTANVCFLNQRPRESRCHLMPEDGGNTLAGINLFTVWFWRYHNFVAKQLAAINPCWDDNKLFDTAREINIAVSLQMYYYELLPLYFGYDNMVHDDVITATGSFRETYDPRVLPQLSLEYPFVLRWVHTIQEGSLKMYDKDGYYLRQVPIVNLTLRTGFFGVDNNMDYLTQGSFRQSSAKIDYISDPDITEVGLGPHQYMSDIMTNDLAKNRYFGFQPYVKYREFCFGKPIRSFDDLQGIIDPERIEILRDVYEKVEDIDLLAGIWVEKPIPGGLVPGTFYCLVIEQLKRNTVSDRHWYERPNRPNAFTYAQLAEIRSASVARFLCDVGDTVEIIQPQAFLKAGFNNPMCSCDQIPKIDFTAWRDETCGYKYV